MMEKKRPDFDDDRLLPSYEEARSRLLDAIDWRLPAETVPVAESLGRVLREDARSRLDVPPFDKSAMDGFAVRAEDLKTASAEAPVILAITEDLPAGTSPRSRVGKGQAARIMTGAPLPKGADAVVMVERTEPVEGRRGVKVFGSVQTGDNTGKRGEDVIKGDLVIASGSRLGPAEIGMLASIGKASVRVSRRPRLAVISTGDEVRPPGERLRKGQIYDANGYSIFGLALELGGHVVAVHHVKDDPRALKAALAALPADVVVMTGGVSVGDYDFAPEVLRSLGLEEIFHKAFIQPGKPTFAGKKGKKLFLGLPGNPVSAMVCFELFARPAIDLLTGAATLGLPRGKAILDADFKTRPGRRKFIRAAIVELGPQLKVRPHPSQKSGVLSSMMTADVLIDLPGETASIKAGETVEILWRRQR